MKQLDGCIRFWEGKLQDAGYLLEPSTEVLIKETIRFLKELREMKREKE